MTLSPEIAIREFKPNRVKAKPVFRAAMVHKFEAGDKRLTLLLGFKDDVIIASTKISKIEKYKYEKGATTALYRKALDIMQQAADKKGIPVYYEAVTPNEKMKNWIKHPLRGAGVFDWDEIQEDENGSLLRARKVIQPNS